MSRSAANYDPNKARELCAEVEPGAVLSYDDLPLELREDEDFEPNLEIRGMSGTERDNLRFRLVRVPLHLFANHAREQGLHGFFAEMIEADEQFAAEAAEHEEPQNENGRERYEIAKRYLSRFESGEEVEPIVVEFAGIFEDRPDILDGYHRLVAAQEARVDEILAYEVLPPASNA